MAKGDGSVGVCANWNRVRMRWTDSILVSRAAEKGPAKGYSIAPERVYCHPIVEERSAGFDGCWSLEDWLASMVFKMVSPALELRSFTAQSTAASLERFLSLYHLRLELDKKDCL